MFSRYAQEFVELEHVATGGFGSVYKARNKLDENEYAIKKIFFKRNSEDTTKVSYFIFDEINF